MGSYIKGSNNMVCREWVWKGLPLGARQGSDPGFMRTNTKVDLDGIVVPYIDVVRKVWLLGFSPRSVTFSPFSHPPLPPFILIFPSRSSLTCPFFLVRGGYSSYQSIRQNGWEKLDSMV